MPQLPEEQLPPQLLPPVLARGISGSTEKPMYVRSMLTPPTVSRRSPAMQKVNPSCSKTLSSGVGSSRARARRGPRQPPAARYTRIGVLSLSAKYASSSWEAVSLIVIMVVSSGINDEEGKRTNAGKRHIRLLQKVVCKSQMAREPFVRAFLTESLFAQRDPAGWFALSISVREGLSELSRSLNLNGNRRNCRSRRSRTSSRRRCRRSAGGFRIRPQNPYGSCRRSPRRPSRPVPY